MLKYSAGSGPEHTWMGLGQQCKRAKPLCILKPSHKISIYTGSPDTAGTSSYSGLICRAKTTVLCFPSSCSSGQELCLSVRAREVTLCSPTLTYFYYQLAWWLNFYDTAFTFLSNCQLRTCIHLIRYFCDMLYTTVIPSDGTQIWNIPASFMLTAALQTVNWYMSAGN